ncbi:MAG: hypothetical protein IKO32_08840 [Lachnospiraceae bacterium]|nr:hypothetical protein [Lachnospiraceae bacterium]
MEKRIAENKVSHYNISCEERFNQYLRFMNEDVEKGYNLRCRYLYKIYQVGISSLYTKDERKDVVNRLLKNASEQTDENNRALDLICAYKMVQYNKFDIDVPHFRVSETLWTDTTAPKKEFPESILKMMSEERRRKTLACIENYGPNEEILDLYNVAIQRNWFGGFNPMKTEVDDGIYDGMNEIEAFNRRNNNAIKCMTISLLYNKRIAKNIEYFRLSFEDGKPCLYRKEIKDIPDLNFLEDSGKNSIEYYWVVFNSSPELFDKNSKVDIEDVDMKTYKVAMFYKDFDHSSGNLHVLPGAMQVWEKEESVNEDEFWIRDGKINQKYHEKTPGCKCKGGRIYAEDGWKPVAVTDEKGKDREKTRNHYIFWYLWGDSFKYLRYAIGKSDFESLKVNEKCKATFSKDFYRKALVEKIYADLKLSPGQGTYFFLKFNNRNPISGYRVIYVAGEGYFYDFNGKENPYQEGKIINLMGKKIKYTPSPNDFITVEENRGYWELNYSKGVAQA